MDPTPKRRSAVEYAEQVLDVHAPWKEAQERLDYHDTALNEVDRLKGEIRLLKQRIEDRKMEIATEAPSTQGYPEGVQARRDFVKLLQANDTALSELEEQIVQAEHDRDEWQSTAKHHELGLHVLTARMNGLGGLLQFYAVAKQAETAQISPQGE